MDKPLIRRPATDANGQLGCGLRLSELLLDIHMVHALEDAPPIGTKSQNGASLALRHWPDHFWHVGKTLKLSADCVDISHGHTVLLLSGPGALYFLADYATADLQSATYRLAKTVRTQLGQYSVLLWWSTTSDIHIAICRSHAQSFVEHLRLLVQRRTASEHMG
jgi:hypothetical protein